MKYLTPIYLCHDNGQSMVIYFNQYLICIEWRLCDPHPCKRFVVADNNSGSFGLLKNQKDRIGHNFIYFFYTINGSYGV